MPNQQWGFCVHGDGQFRHDRELQCHRKSPRHHFQAQWLPGVGPVEKLRLYFLGHRPVPHGGQRRLGGRSERGGVAARDDDVMVEEFQQVSSAGLFISTLGN